MASSFARSASKPVTSLVVGSCCDSSGASSASPTMSLPRFLMAAIVEFGRMSAALPTRAFAYMSFVEAEELGSVAGTPVAPLDDDEQPVATRARPTSTAAALPPARHRLVVLPNMRYLSVG